MIFDPWYIDIPKGVYTTKEMVELSVPKQTYCCVYQTLRKLEVESFYPKEKETKYNQRNEKHWKWLGSDYYIKLQMREKKKRDKEKRAE